MRLSEIGNISPGRDYYDVKSQLQRHIYLRSEQAFDAGDKARNAIKTKQELKRRQQFIRNKFITSIGGLPASNTKLKAKQLGTINEPGLRIEKIIFQSRPNVFVTANLYVPSDITEPSAAVLFLCGHHLQAKHEPEYQIVCRYLAKAGLTVLAQDPIGQGERLSYYEKSLGSTTITPCVLEHDYAGQQCFPLGDCIARYFLHDAMRGFDYLCSRPEVDPERIGVTGNSGGGLQTAMMMMADKRVAAAVPVTFIMNRKAYMYSGGAQDAEQIWPGLTAHGIDHEDIILAMAPKPVRVQAVKYDYFPIEGTRMTVDRCKRFWEMSNCPEYLDLIEDASTHAYTRKLARSAAEFFSVYLLANDKLTIDEKSIEPIEPKKLWCTKTGYVRGEMPRAKFVFEENLDRLRNLQKQVKKQPVELRSKKAIRWLKKIVFNNRLKVEPNPRIYHKDNIEDLAIEAAFWFSQQDIINCAIAFRDLRHQDVLPVTIALWDKGTQNIEKHFNWIRETCQKQKRAVLVIDVTGMGALEPNSHNHVKIHECCGSIQKLNDDLMWLNDSLAAMRIYDVTRAIDALKYWPRLDNKNIQIYTCGYKGVYGQPAAAIDKRIINLEIANGMGSYKSWVSSRHYNSYDARSWLIPGILKYCDLPDLKKQNNLKTN